MYVLAVLSWVDDISPQKSLLNTVCVYSHSYPPIFGMLMFIIVSLLGAAAFIIFAFLYAIEAYYYNGDLEVNW